MVANFEAVAQRIFEEDCVERWVVLLEIGGAFDIASTVFANDPRDFINDKLYLAPQARRALPSDAPVDLQKC